MAKPKSNPTHPFLGRFRITFMDQWGQGFVDEEVEGFFEFKEDCQGELHFGYVHGVIDYRPTTKDGNPCVDFTWQGNDEMDSVMCRGWAVIDGDEIEGKLFFHQGDESGFKAKRTK